MPRPNRSSLEPARVFDSLGEAVIAVDKGSALRIYNPAAARRIGVPVSEALNRMVHTVILNTRLSIFDSEGSQIGAVAAFRGNAEMIAGLNAIKALFEAIFPRHIYVAFSFLIPRCSRDAPLFCRSPDLSCLNGLKVWSKICSFVNSGFVKVHFAWKE